MSNIVSIIHPVNELRVMAKSFAQGGLFGFKNEDQIMSLMLIAQAENKHPATVAAEYDFIQGKAALKATAIVSRFQNAGGKIEFHELTDLVCDATFSHPDHAPVNIRWDMQRASTAGLNGKDIWKKYPRAMLRSRCVAEGVRTLLPECLNGFYSSDEIRDIEKPVEKDITPREALFKKTVIDAVGDQLPYSPEPVKIANSELELSVMGAIEDGIKLGAVGENALQVVLDLYKVDKIGELNETQAYKVIANINKKIEALEVSESE